MPLACHSVEHTLLQWQICLVASTRVHVVEYVVVGKHYSCLYFIVLLGTPACSGVAIRTATPPHYASGILAVLSWRQCTSLIVMSSITFNVIDKSLILTLLLYVAIPSRIGRGIGAVSCMTILPWGCLEVYLGDLALGSSVRGLSDLAKQGAWSPTYRGLRNHAPQPGRPWRPRGHVTQSRGLGAS